MVEVLTPRQWAQRHFGGVELGDERRTKRAVAYAAAAAAAPSESVPRQCAGEWKQTKGAYRLFDQPQVTFRKLQAPHYRQTLAAAACERRVVLWVSDTTTLSIDHPGTDGLGPTSGGGGGCCGQGMLLHSTMAVDASGGVGVAPFVLGLGYQQVWARDPKPKPGAKPGAKGKTRTKAKGKAREKEDVGDPPPPPESAKWPAGVKAVGAPPAGVRWIHVGDAESDCWEAIEACRQHGSGLAIRACQNRQVIAGHAPADEPAPPGGEPTLLFDLLKRQPVLGGRSLWVRGRPGREPRWAKLAVSAAPVTLLPPKNWSDKPHRKGTPRPEPARCWAVRVWELDPPAGEDPIEWVILTDEPATDLASAVLVVFWYSCRWLIEEYHKCLKSGCRVEDRQLQKAERLEALLGILAVVAVRLLQLKHQAKVNPDAPARSVVPGRYVRTLAAYLKRPPDALTTRTFWRETARLGGFLGRKSDGDPGWLTLWRGWQHLETLTIGAELAERMK